MIRFRYTAKRTVHETEAGHLTAESKEAAAHALHERGLFPLFIGADDEEGSVSWLDTLGRTAPRTWDRRHQALFVRELSDLLGGGLTVDAALSVLANQANRPGVRSMLSELRFSVRGGESLASAMGRQKGMLPSSLTSSVEAGEVGGGLEKLLGNVADLLEEDDRTIRSIREAVAYPALVAAVGVVTLIVLFAFVLPRIEVLYGDLGQTLPLPTRALLLSSRVVVFGGLPMVGALALAALLGFRQFDRSETFRVKVTDLCFALPVVGKVLRLREIARLSRILSSLVGGGVPALEALGHAVSGSVNARVRRDMVNVESQVRGGKALSEAMASSTLFRGSIVSLIRVGEERGDLESAFAKIADLHLRELREETARAKTLLEPLLILALGVLVSFVVFAMMLPILQLDLSVG